VLAHSEEVAEQLRAGARVAERARIQRGGQTMLDGLQLLDVTVDLDENAASERSFSALIADPDGSLRPQLGTDALAPFGNELVYEIGVWRPSIADFEWSSAGVYRLSVTGGDTTRTLQLKGLDRSVVIARARNEVPYVILGGTPLAQAIYDYAAAKFPDVEFEADPDAWTTKISSTPAIRGRTCEISPRSTAATCSFTPLAVSCCSRSSTRPRRSPRGTTAPATATWRRRARRSWTRPAARTSLSSWPKAAPSTRRCERSPK
jgi:hypothetical protein